MTIGWYEEYQKCGCISGIAKRRKDLLGYCPKHGTDRARLYRDHRLPGMQAPELTNADIRRIVQVKLQGFAVRQAMREARRARKGAAPAVAHQEELFSS